MSDLKVIGNIKQDDTGSGMSRLVLRIAGLLLTAAYELSFFVPRLKWAYILRWPAFTVFACLLNEGFCKTGNRLLYGRRLFIFALISEPFYNLLRFGRPFESASQNVIFTLFVAYLGLVALDALRRRYENTFVTLTAAILLSIFCGEIGSFCLFEMSEYGFMLIFMFNIAEHITYTKLLHFAAMLYLIAGSSERFGGIPIRGVRYEVPVQVCMLAALVLIWSYKGRQGLASGTAKRIYYILYPALLLILWLVKISLFARP